MSPHNQTFQTQLSSIQNKLGISLDELTDIVKRTGLSEHRQIRAMFQREYGLDYGEATTLVQAIVKSAVEV